MRKRTLGPLLVLVLLVPTVSASGQTLSPTPGPVITARAAEQADERHPADRRKVILDADMGELNDDAVTMFMLAKHPSVDLLGVTVVSGNTWVEEGTADALRQLELIGRRDVPVVAGAGEPLMPGRKVRLAAENALYGKAPWAGAFDSPRPPAYDRLPRPPYGGYPSTHPSTSAAADFIVNQVKRYPRQVTFLEVGPATNLALAVRTHPEIVPLVKEVIYMGGAFDKPGNITPAAEFNWWFDPESARIALRTPFPKQTIVPDDVCVKVRYTKAQYDAITAGAPTPVKTMFKDLQGPMFAADPRRSTFLWDALTAAVFLDPQVVKTSQSRYVDVDASFGPDYGRALGYGLDEFSAPANPVGTQRATLILDLDMRRFWDLYIGLLRRP
ncbi:nucleoside hydrolase [Streptomyces sp. DSM 41987]|uniref:nucleoside hydrolase n=1 Tax=Streptomyces TaxID=1883 RepID=UPI003614E52D